MYCLGDLYCVPEMEVFFNKKKLSSALLPPIVSDAVFRQADRICRIPGHVKENPDLSTFEIIRRKLSKSLAGTSYCLHGRHGARGHTVGDPSCKSLRYLCFSWKFIKMTLCLLKQ